MLHGFQHHNVRGPRFQHQNVTHSHFEMTLTKAVPGTTPGQPLGICLQIHHDSLACWCVLLTCSGCTQLARVTTKSPVRLLSKFIEKQLCVTIAFTLTILESLNDKDIYRYLGTASQNSEWLQTNQHQEMGKGESIF